MEYYEKLRLIKLGLLPKESGAKPKKAIPKVSEKKKAEMKAEKEARGGEKTPLVKWFEKQMKMMPEVCEETGLKIERKIYKYAIMSICHILPKSKCKSVALHPLNRVFLLPDLHTKFDAMSWEEREQMGCWQEIKNRLIMVYPDLAESEKRHFPEKLRKEIEDNEPFK